VEGGARGVSKVVHKEGEELSRRPEKKHNDLEGKKGEFH